MEVNTVWLARQQKITFFIYRSSAGRQMKVSIANPAPNAAIVQRMPGLRVPARPAPALQDAKVRQGTLP